MIFCLLNTILPIKSNKTKPRLVLRFLFLCRYSRLHLLKDTSEKICPPPTHVPFHGYSQRFSLCLFWPAIISGMCILSGRSLWAAPQSRALSGKTRYDSQLHRRMETIQPTSPTHGLEDRAEIVEPGGEKNPITENSPDSLAEFSSITSFLWYIHILWYCCVYICI